jgi:hypothetical protein
VLCWTSSNPVGHGFTQTNVDNDFACYSLEPRSNIPIKVIVLDDTQMDNDTSPALSPTSSPGYGHGSLDKTRYDRLVGEIEEGQTNNKLMIIAAHIPPGVEKATSFVAWSSVSATTEQCLSDKVHTYPNLILWITGHRHHNAVTAFRSPDDPGPELVFWQIETASLRDFPQQFRTFEIVRNSDNTVSIVTTCVDPAVKDGSPAATSRSYGIEARQLYAKTLSSNPVIPLMPAGSYNAELVKQLSPEMQAKIQNYGTSIRK